MKKVFFSSYFGFINLINSYQIVSLFDMYIDMGGRIAGKEDSPSPINEGPLNSSKIAQNIFTFWLIYGKLFFFPCCT